MYLFLSARYVQFVHFSISFYISTSALLRKNFDLHKTQSYCNFLKTFKFGVILVHHSHQSSSVWNESWGGFRNTWSESRLTCLNKWRFCFSQCTFSLKCRFFVTTSVITKQHQSTSNFCTTSQSKSRGHFWACYSFDQWRGSSAVLYRFYHFNFIYFYKL